MHTTLYTWMGVRRTNSKTTYSYGGLRCYNNSSQEPDLVFTFSLSSHDRNVSQPA